MKNQLFATAIVVAAATTLALKVQAQESSPAATSAASSSTTTTASSQKADTEWEGVSVELTGVTKGEGDTITIKWKYTNSGSKKADIWRLGAIGHDEFGEHVYYVDPGNKKKYLVVKDATGKPVANALLHFELDGGASRGGWAKFPAPPAGVTKISIYLPGAPPFEGVTIQ